MSVKKKKSHTIQNKKSNANLLFIGIIVLLTFICYTPALKHDFLRNWDDHEYVINNPDIKELSAQNIKTIFSKFYIGNYQPLTMLSYAIDYALFDLSPKAYHTTNLILHLLSTILVFFFILLLTEKKEVAIATASFFALHPCHVESVAWIAERKDVLYGFFFIASLLYYMKFLNTKHNIKYYYFCLVLFILSCLSKSAAVVLPIILVLIDYYKTGAFNIKSQLNKIPFFAISLLFGITALISQESAGATNMAPHYPIFERIFLISWSVVFYIIKSILPMDLSAMYYYPKSTSALPFYYYLSPFILIAITWAILKTKTFKKELVFASLFFLSTIILIVQIVPLGRTITADRYTYIPYIAIGFLLGQFYIYTKENIIRISDSLKKATYYSFFIFIIICSVITWNRSKLWKDSITLFSDVIEKYPEQSHPYLVKAAALMDLQDFKNALNNFTLGIERDSTYAEAWNNRGNAYFNIKDYESAIKDYTTAIELDKKYQLPYNNRGSCKRNKGDYVGAVSDFSKAIELDTAFFVAYHNRGLTKYYMKDYSGALEDYNKTIQIKPDYPDAYSNRGVAKYYLKDYKGAIPDYDKAIALNPAYGEAYSNRAAVKFFMNDRKGSCDDWHKAVQTGYASASEMIKIYCK